MTIGLHEQVTLRTLMYQSNCILASQIERDSYLRLAHIALNLITIPLISSNPKRIFSLIGLLLTANRAQLQSDIIGALMAIGSWDRERVINIVDGRLKRPAMKEIA